MSSKEHGFIHKVKEILIEIAIIVFAVTLSIWLHGWSEHNHQQKEVSNFLVDLKNDLTTDVTNMKEQLKNLESDIVSFDRALNRQDSSLAKADINFNIINRTTAQGNYEGFKSSGKIGFIEEKQLKKEMLAYYQQNMPELTDLEKTYNTRIYEIFEYPETSYAEPTVRKKLELSKLIAQALKSIYEKQIAEANNIIQQIEASQK